MADIFVDDGSWAVDTDTVRIIPGSGRDVHELRKTLGALEVPIHAIAGAAFEPARKGGYLRLRLRSGADPLTDIAAGALGAPADPYRLVIPKDRTGVAEYIAAEIRDLLAISPPSGPRDGFLLPGPDLPVTATAGDGTVSFDGARVHIEWTLFAKSAKQAAGPQEFPLSAITGVEWKPQSGVGYGSLRFRVRGEGPTRSSEEDPRCLAWGIQRYGGTTALVAAAVHARLSGRAKETPAPALPPAPASPSASAPPGPDVLIRRLSELGELHRAGVLTDEEFSAAKQTLLQRISEL